MPVPKSLLGGVLPVVYGPRVFTASEYAKATGLKPRSIRERLHNLAEEGKVERVRTKRDGKIVRAWRYLGK